MSLGVTPYEFVQKVFYMQEKVLLDFHPDDDVYKEVLVEGNMVLEELQTQEDWLWLRDTLPVGFTDGNYDFESPCHGKRPWIKQKGLELPKYVYKPSELYGDCVRLARWFWRQEFLEEFKNYENQFDYWNKLFTIGVIEPDRIGIMYGEVDMDDPIDHGQYTYYPRAKKTTGTITYGKSYLEPLIDVGYEKLRELIQPDRWYLDSDGRVFFSRSAYPNCIYCCEPAENIPDNAWTKYFNLRHKHKEESEHIHDMICCCPHHHHDLPWIYPKWATDPHPIYSTLNKLNWEFIVDKIEVEPDYHALKIQYRNFGAKYRDDSFQMNELLQAQPKDKSVYAVMRGNTLEFTRRLRPHESNRVIVMDVQRRIEPFHVCNHNCKSLLYMKSGKRSDPTYPDNPCVEQLAQSEKRMLTEIPDPQYVIARTAALHAEGSPAATGRVQSLQDQAQKLLSAMRQNNAEATYPEYLDWSEMEYINVV